MDETIPSTNKVLFTKPLATLKQLDYICNKMDWTWELDNNGGIVIYTGLKVGPSGLIPYEDTDEPECGS